MRPCSITLALVAFPLLLTAAPAPTVAEAQSFMDRAEAELLKLGIAPAARRMGRGNLHHRRHGTARRQRERASHRAHHRTGQRRQALRIPQPSARPEAQVPAAETLAHHARARKTPNCARNSRRSQPRSTAATAKANIVPAATKNPASASTISTSAWQRAAIRKTSSNCWAGWHKVGAPDARPLCAFRRALESGRAGTGLRRYRSALALRLRHDARSSFPPNWNASGSRSSRSIRNCTPTFAAS